MISMTQAAPGSGQPLSPSFRTAEVRALAGLLARLNAEGDARAERGGRQARRTLQQMDPGFVRPPLLTMVPAAAVSPGGGQCSGCGNWFPDWNGGVCTTCRMAGR